MAKSRRALVIPTVPTPGHINHDPDLAKLISRSQSSGSGLKDSRIFKDEQRAEPYVPEGNLSDYKRCKGCGNRVKMPCLICATGVDF